MITAGTNDVFKHSDEIDAAPKLQQVRFLLPEGAVGYVLLSVFADDEEYVFRLPTSEIATISEAADGAMSYLSGRLH